ncbi:hypothetical protein CR513_13817, partial [Mucuna pruriens]
MEKTSWACTVITQVCLCCALYISLNLGHPQTSLNINASSDLYFISVKGGFRPLTQQFHLLKQLLGLILILLSIFLLLSLMLMKMEKVASAYKASFVVSSSELGEYDPLMQNATEHFPSLRLPWYTTYTTTSSKPKGQEVGCFVKKIKTSNGITLDVISVDTELLQDSVLRGSLSVHRNNQLNWLIKTLAANSSNWRIVVGYRPLVVCGENKEQLKKTQNVYLSGQDCSSHAIDASVAYIGNPDPIAKEPYSIFLNGNSVYKRELANGFLLHRVSSLKIVTYYINFAGEVAFTTVLQQKGREIILH